MSARKATSWGAGPRASHAGGVRFVLRCWLDHGTRRPRGRPQAPRNVHRLDRRARTASPRLRGRGQRGGRGAGRLLRHHRRDAAGRQRGPGAGQRPRHPGRRAPGRAAAGGRGRDDHAARRRQVRRQVLRGLRRPARRRRRPWSTRCPCGSRWRSAATGTSGRRPTSAATPTGPLVQAARRPTRPAPRSRSGRTTTIFETTEWSLRDAVPAVPGDGLPEQGPGHHHHG